MNIDGHLYEGADEAAIEQFETYLESVAAPEVPHESPISGDTEALNSAPVRSMAVSRLRLPRLGALPGNSGSVLNPWTKVSGNCCARRLTPH